MSEPVRQVQEPANRIHLIKKDYEGANSTLCRGCGHDAFRYDGLRYDLLHGCVHVLRRRPVLVRDRVLAQGSAYGLVESQAVPVGARARPRSGWPRPWTSPTSTS